MGVIIMMVMWHGVNHTTNRPCRSSLGKWCASRGFCIDPILSLGICKKADILTGT
jgi:hypothetical protein